MQMCESDSDLADEIDRDVTAGTCRATREELAKIDTALAAVRRGEVATEAVFDRQRRI
jgi:hypothetical protein